MNDDLKELIADVREQVRYLQELGVDSLGVEFEGPKALPAEKEPATHSGVDAHEPGARLFARETSEASQPKTQPGSRLASLPSLSKRETTRMHETTNEPETDGPETLFGDSTTKLPEPVETIGSIRAEIGSDCTRCKLCELGRSQVVNSVGNFNADLMFVGEAPGADEDKQGEPFVGRAGQLLTDIIEKGLQMRREDVFIGNINRCRPPGNRAPEPDETAACKPFLVREIAVVRPRVIVVLGATAAHNLLETKTPISKLRGHFHDHLGVKVMPTFHPAYLLRDPHKKREVWEDIKMVRDYLRG